MELTTTQKQIIEDIDNAILVTAPAGAGKTEVMARRAAHALKQGKQNLLCLTFTNRAANAMKKRVIALTNNASNITICTVHAFCNMVIRAEAKSLGMPFGYTIIDEEDAKAVLQGLLSPGKKQLTDHDLRSAMTTLDDYRLALVRNKSKLGDLTKHFTTRFSANLPDVLAQYLHQLQSNNTLDFLSLILNAYLFFQNQDNLLRWQNIYDFIQVDEMQDTGLIEYDMIEKLAKKHKNLSLFGDTNQTIYEWRDSRPFEILAQFKSEFKPKPYMLSHNFRSTKNITHAAEHFLACYFDKDNKNIDVAGEQGEKTSLCFLNTIDSEKKQIVQILKKQASTGESFGHMAVLTRTNKDARAYSQALQQASIPCYVVDEYNFFRREEIKDALSALKLLLNASDTQSATRLLTKYATNIGPKTIADIIDSPLPVSLQDFICHAHQPHDDLIADVINPYNNNQMVIFDVESTGLNTQTDDIVEIAAVRFGIDGILDEFHHYLKPTKPVGASVAVHGYTDAYLAKNGEDAKQVLNDFLQFTKGCILAGHNVTYDIAILSSQLERLSINYNQFDVYFDTLTAAKRIIKQAKNYKLGTLCSLLGIEEEPTHHAMDDVWATCELAELCFEQIIATTEKRLAFYNTYRDKFKPFASLLAQAITQVTTLRPDELLSKMIDTLAIKKHYAKFKNKIANLDELVTIFGTLDEWQLPPQKSLRQILELVTLSGSLERQIGGEARVAVLTVHQAKGLQFGTVIIANAVEGAFPSSLNIRYDKCDEEARLFYVAMTRASKHLFITLSALNERGEQNKSSRFIKCLPKDAYEIFAQTKKEDR